MTRKKHNQPAQTPPDGPARILESHVRDRILMTTAGAPKGYRNMSPLEQAFCKGQLKSVSEQYSAFDRLEAGNNYADLHSTAFGSGGTDSTQKLNLSRASGRFNISPPRNQLSAARTLAEIEKLLASNDKIIIRKVCGEGHKPAAVIKILFNGGYVDAVTARFRESLDALIEAFEQHRRGGRGDSAA